MPHINKQYYAERLRLGGMLSLYFDWLLWIADWCRGSGENDQSKDPMGFVFQAHELQCMNIDCNVVFSRLMAGDTVDPWVVGTSHFDYVNKEGAISTAAPGTDIDGLRFERLHFKPEPHYLPFVVFFNSMQKICEAFKMNYLQLLFRFRGHSCDEPMRLVRMLRSYEFDIDLFLLELRDWFVASKAYLNHIPTRNLPDEGTRDMVSEGPLSTHDILLLLSPYFIHALDENDPRIQTKVTRQIIARIVRVSSKTLYRWEKNGNTSNNMPWPEPEERKGNVVLYHIPRYLKSMQTLVPVSRDSQRDQQLRDEIFSM